MMLALVTQARTLVSLVVVSPMDRKMMRPAQDLYQFD